MAVPTNTVLPSITPAGNTLEKGNVITGHLGTWGNTPTLYTYEFRWLLQRGDTGFESYTGYPYGNPGWQTIPGTSGTTSSASTTPTYTIATGDASRNIILHVSASNVDGALAKDSNAVIYYSHKIPFKSTGNWMTTPISSPVYSDELTTIFRDQMTSYRDPAGWNIDWWLQGGNYGDSYAIYIERVTSDMPRTPFLLAGPGTYGNHDLRNPPTAKTKNGFIDTHLAWTIGQKTLADMGLTGASGAGIPTPPGGFRVPGGQDAHLFVFVEDTYELYELWATYYITPGQSSGGVPYDTAYDNQWVCFWGGYMRDVREHDGRWFGDRGGPGGGTYRLDVDGNQEYAGWGGTATSINLGAVSMLMRELTLDDDLDHALGFIMPGHQYSFAFPASREASGEPGGQIMQGGLWTIDPAFDISGLASLGDPVANEFRRKIFTAIQRFGATNFDSTGSVICIKQEAIGGTWPDIPNVAAQNASMNQIMDSVPFSAWKVMSPSWRPAGYAGNAKTATIQEDWTTAIDSSRWASGGTTASGGHLTLSGTSAVLYPATWSRQSLVASTAMVETVTMPSGATKNMFQIVPPNTEYNSDGLAFNIIGGNLHCLYYDWWNNNYPGEVTVTFDPVAHKKIRFRMHADTHVVDWQVSPGGAGTPADWTWTTLRSEQPSWIDLEEANICFRLTGATSQTAVWGPLNLPADPAPVDQTIAWSLGIAY